MEKSNVNQAQERFMAFINSGEYQSFFRDTNQKKKISDAIDAYNFLKTKYADLSCDLSKDADFQMKFKSYYGMQRGTTDEFIKKYFNTMQEMRDSKNEYSIDELEKMICEGEKLHFSFMTKLLNIYNDEKYPIYDSKVAYVFGCDGVLSANRRFRLMELKERYKQIADTYHNLLENNEVKSVLGKFREEFTVAEKFSDMRIMDILFWQLGKHDVKIMREEKKKEKPITK